MTYNFNHVHLKAPDPGKTADWYVAAFDFEIVDDQTPGLRGIDSLGARLKMVLL